MEPLTAAYSPRSIRQMCCILTQDSRQITNTNQQQAFNMLLVTATSFGRRLFDLGKCYGCLNITYDWHSLSAHSLRGEKWFGEGWESSRIPFCAGRLLNQ